MSKFKHPGKPPSQRRLATPTGTPDDRQYLIDFNREKIEFYYLEAVAKVAPDPVVVVMDLRDPDAARIYDNAFRKHHPELPESKALLDDGLAKGVAPTFIFCPPREAARADFAEFSPNGRNMLYPARPGTFWVVAIGGGGVRYAMLPIPPASKD